MRCEFTIVFKLMRHQIVRHLELLLLHQFFAIDRKFATFWNNKLKEEDIHSEVVMFILTRHFNKLKEIFVKTYNEDTSKGKKTGNVAIDFPEFWEFHGAVQEGLSEFYRLSMIAPQQSADSDVLADVGDIPGLSSVPYSDNL